ncbi:MAG: LapA family protein [Pseudomonadota bacterium]|nr:LapA family protein [Pseudomonadota bacterium]
MGNIIKIFLLVAVILLVSLVLGMYQIQNDHDIQVDLIYFAEPIEMSVARFGMAFFFGGVLVGIGLCVLICLVLGIELKAARRQAKKLAKELEKMRERNLKEPT